MTFAIFIVLFLGLLVTGLNFLPDATALNDSFASSLHLIVGTMKAWNFMFAISDLFVCLTIVLTFEAIVWGWHAIKWMLHIIRGSNDSA